MKRGAQYFEEFLPSSKHPKYSEEDVFVTGFPQGMSMGNMERQLRAIEEEDGPLGLKLRKTMSFIDHAQVSLSMQKLQQPHQQEKQQTQMSSSALDKKKATNFAAASLKIGAWEYISRYECDLVVKCYFAKRKLVWEVLEGGLKSKIEIQWLDISGLRASFPENQPSRLEIELSRPPMFFKESNPQPRKHTIWQATSDFTGGQATTFRRHVLHFPNEAFEKHYDTLLLSDERLNKLSKKTLSDKTPYFSSRLGGLGFHHLHHNDSYLSVLKATMPSLFQSNNNPHQQRSSSSPHLPSLRETTEEHQTQSYDLTRQAFSDSMKEMRRPGSSASESTGMSEGVSGARASPFRQDMLNDISQYLLDDSHTVEQSLAHNQGTLDYDEGFLG